MDFRVRNLRCVSALSSRRSPARDVSASTVSWRLFSSRSAACSEAVREGEAVAIMGPSGCGKTTLLTLPGGRRPSDDRQNPDRRATTSGDFGVCDPWRLDHIRRCLPRL
jgi:translation initiation factor RLI1